MKKHYFLKKPSEQLRYVFTALCLLMATSILAQTNITVSGKVIEADTQMPLPGVNIVEQGTSNGTISDFDGNYSLTVNSSDAILVISYVGFKTQEIPISGQSEINVQMEADSQTLDEVVLVGYGTQRKSDLTGAIASVDSKSITERNLTSPVEAIQGNVPGVVITSSSGSISGGFDVVIRGKNSTNSSAPLYIVDGVPIDDISFLNPQDISQIDVLKDASSTAIYGSRGSNGVILVTTKSGATAKSGFNITFDSFAGIKEVARFPDFMDGEKWWYWHRSHFLERAPIDPNTGTVTEETLLQEASFGGTNDLFFERARNNDVFDWKGAVLRSGIQRNNYLSVSGRSDNGMAYNLGLGLQNETGNLENESLDKYNVKLGLLHNINQKFSYGINVTLNVTDEEAGNSDAMVEAFRMSPFFTPYDLDGELTPLPGKLVGPEGTFIVNKTSTYNPILNIRNSHDQRRIFTGVGSAFFEYNPLSWLSLKTTYSAGWETLRRGRSWTELTQMGVWFGNKPLAMIDHEENFNYTWDNQFNIDYTFGEDHDFKLLGLQSLFTDRREYSSASSRSQPFDTGFYNLGSGQQETFGVGSAYSKTSLSSYALRLNYSYKDKYLLTLSNRWDGSSLLSEGRKWESFPSGAVAWRISEEPFLAESNIVSNLKLRASYGFTGNNVIAPYSTLNTLDIQTYYDFNGSNANGWLPGSIANNQLGWEKTEEWNFGVDFGFLSNRITGSLDVYDRLSEDLLQRQQLPRESGWNFITSNVGSVSNKGIEAGLGAVIIQSDKVSWDANITFSKNTNKIVSIYGQTEADDIGNNLFIGESIDAIYNYKFDGVWQADERELAQSYNQREGQAKVVDVNGDGVIDPDNDRFILGSSDPDWSGGFFTTLRVGNFDLSASAIARQGVLIYSAFHRNFTDVSDQGRQKLDISWYIPENDAGLEPQFSNTIPQPLNEGIYWRNNNVGHFKDASFVKVKNISLGYNFNDAFTNRLGMEQLRLYANVLNPFVFTDYEGYDPEWAAAGLGRNRVSTVTYQLGISLKL